ncbi:MAG: TorF family putative porin [Halothiobacillus sp.]
MNKLKMTLMASALLTSLTAMMAPVVFAEDVPAPAPAVTVTGSAAVVSDYRFRGISQTFKKPAAQVGINLGLPAGFYAGFWGSNVSGIQYLNGNLESDWFAGYTYHVSDDLALDVGGIYVYYPAAYYMSGMDKINYNTLEWHVAATYKWLTAKYNITSSNFYGAIGSKGSAYYQLDANYPLTDSLTLNAHVGHQKVKGAGNDIYDNTDWLLGATYTMPTGTFAPGWAVSLAYVDTNAKKGPYTYSDSNGTSKFLGGPTAVLSVSKSF